MGYMDNFRSTRMPRDFHKFAEKAIEIAGKAGERKRQFRTQTASNLARTRMAELTRSETGATKRQGMIEAGKEKRGGFAGAGGTRMKSFDFASKSMSEMYPNRINPATNKPFTFKAWKQRLTEFANSREAYGGLQPAGEQQPIDGGMQGKGRVVTEGGRQFDVTPGGRYSEGMASPGMMEAAGFLPQVPANRFAQIAAAGAQNEAPVVPGTATSTGATTPTALEIWEKKYPRRKKIRGAMGGEDPIKTFMRSLTKPIDRSRLGRQYDYMSRFGSQQGYNR
jgi:hypothetical protein